MKHLLVANKGLLAVEALTLLGASSKRGDSSKIGKFGSGNKYALAYFLRKGCQVRIFSGNTEIKLTLVPKAFREMNFDVIAVNGVETSITTEFGYEWSIWQAIRELYTNAVDEGLLYFGITDVGFVEEEAHNVLPVGDYPANEQGIDLKETTRIYIEASAEVQDFMFNIRDYIATKNEVLFECEHGKIYRKHSSKTCIYYRGIRCFETKKESIYDYDFENVTLDENRLIMFSWSLAENMWKILFACNDTTIIRTLLTSIAEAKFIENEIDGSFVDLPVNIHEDAWREGIGDSTICPRDLGGYVKDEERPHTKFLPSKLYNSLVGILGDGVKNKSFTVSEQGIPFHSVDPDVLSAQLLKEVLYFFTECKFDIPYPVVIVDFDDKSVLGAIKDNEILVGVRTMARGKHDIAKTIIEEYIHLKHSAPDKSRQFQEAAIDELISYMKLHNAFTL